MTPLTIGSLTPGQQTPDVTAATDAQRKAARDFEAIFLRQLLSSLEKGGGVGGQSSGGNVFRSMMVSALADTAAEGGGIGLSEVILKAMLPPAPQGAAAHAPAQADPGEPAPQAETQTSPARSSRLGAASQVLTEATRRLMFAGARGGSGLEMLEGPLHGVAPLLSELPPVLHPNNPRANESTSPASGGASTGKPGAVGALPNGNVR